MKKLLLIIYIFSSCAKEVNKGTNKTYYDSVILASKYHEIHWGIDMRYLTLLMRVQTAQKDYISGNITRKCYNEKKRNVYLQ